MRNFFRKYKFQIEIFSIIALALGSILHFIEYPEAKNKKMELIGAIAFGALAIIKLVDIVILYRSKKKAE